MSFPMPKNKSYKTSSYWTPKPVRRLPKAEDNTPETLAVRLKREDQTFERNWRKYWRERGKWASFEEFLKAAA
jgi:hypothetical protein